MLQIIVMTFGEVMNKENSKYTKLIPQYTLFGILFGLIFPILGTLNEIWVHSLGYSWQAILLVQQNHLLWIIDSAPLFLGLFAYNAGVRHQRQADQTDRLGQYVEQRSKDIIRQKLFYEALVDNNPIATVTLDQDHKIISVNPAFESLFGYYQDEVMGKNLDDLISNPDRPQEAVNYGAAHGALAMTTAGDTTTATLAEVEKVMKGAGARVDR